MSTWKQLVEADEPGNAWRINESAGPTATAWTGGVNGEYFKEGTGAEQNFSQESPITGEGTTPKSVFFGGDGKRSSKGAQVRFNSSTIFNISKKFTFEQFFKIEAAPEGGVNEQCGMLLDVMNETTGTAGFSLCIKGTSPKLMLATEMSFSNPRKGIESSSALSLKTWYHLIVTYEEGVGKFFLNGVEIATVTISGSTALPAEIKYTATGATFGGNHQFPTFNAINGDIGDCVWYPNRVLSAARAKEHYEAAFVPNGPLTQVTSVMQLLAGRKLARGVQSQQLEVSQTTTAETLTGGRPGLLPNEASAAANAVVATPAIATTVATAQAAAVVRTTVVEAEASAPAAGTVLTASPSTTVTTAQVEGAVATYNH